jgi:hypothetical protein
MKGSWVGTFVESTYPVSPVTRVIALRLAVELIHNGNNNLYNLRSETH